ncbi:Sphingosine kinase 1 [Sparassis crispa]|uniref:Sphingosine kinase 1 n=1 Tax=Sparassis crispa TaxID=139825 RepID=A0A401GK88_9APHY|nr:Sphingosine kinase 1 [Sparassis crispa]GBE82572.1 Sphingosine kinase 1 [Sparassis crispa]
MPVFVIYNPVCGDGTANELFQEHVLPLIEKSSKVVDKIIVTESQGHAASALRESFAQEDPITVVLGAGDGTLHEIINAPDPKADVSFALVPCGTANALYSSIFPHTGEVDHADYKLKSVQAFVNDRPTIPLTLALTDLDAPDKPRRSVASAVVTSTALHASILHDSEALRSSVPGIERFKVAARQNITRWYRATVRLHPAMNAGRVHIYDPAEGKFVPHPQSTKDAPLVLEGPFAYFVSTVNVDRLEPQFRITPLQSDFKPTEASFDLVVVRPFRDPSISVDSEGTRAAFAPKLGSVLQAAYRNGAHASMRYANDGSTVDEGNGPTVVEYFRCGGWEWKPVSDQQCV